VAATGVHGANRLASNGVTEGLVAGRVVAELLADALPECGEPVLADETLPVADPDDRDTWARAMSRWVGPLREAEGLRSAYEALGSGGPATPMLSLAAVEATNLHAVSELVVRAAQLREESRGSHRRLDFTEPRDEWRRRIVQRWDGRTATTAFEPVEGNSA
jgi:L-aspartate oxidase